MTPSRRHVVDGANAVLERMGGRIVSVGESTENKRLRRALISVYEAKVFPQLRPTSGRDLLLLRLMGTEIPEAFFLLNDLHSSLDSGDGDVCEFGVAQGATSALIANELLGDPSRNLWLYDSFEGLSKPTPEDVLIDDIFDLGSMDRYAGSMAIPETGVRDRLAALGFPKERTRVVRGFISEEIDPVLLPERIAFAYLDFDLYEPILAALRIVHPRTRPGSIMMVDDYGFFSTGPASAVRLFMAEHEGEYRLEESPAFAGHFCSLTRL